MVHLNPIPNFILSLSLSLGINSLLGKNRPKPFNFAIVDEVDSVLIDEGRNPLLISGEVIPIS